MPRRRTRTKLTVSLFPFLSILACVIGTLTLMITALALGQMDNDTVASAENYERIQRRIAEETRLIETLRRQIEQIEAAADDTQKQLADARIKLEQLKRQKEALLAANDQDRNAEPPEIEIPIVDVRKHQQRMAAIEADLLQVQQTVEELEAELAERTRPPDEADVVIQPGGSGLDLQPTFVECTARGIVLLQNDPPTRVNRADLATDETFARLLDQIAARPKASVIFLVRDDAVGMYNAANAVARARFARTGKLPVLGQGNIDLSQFE